MQLAPVGGDVFADVCLRLDLAVYAQESASGRFFAVLNRAGLIVCSTLAECFIKTSSKWIDLSVQCKA